MNPDHDLNIGILTFHVAHNYGAVLQAYALPTALGKMGYHAQVIHYCFPYLYQWSHVEHLNELCHRHGWIGGSLRCLKRACKGEYSKKRKRNKFDRFIHRTIPRSAKVYPDAASLGDNAYDCILFGSDQIWNATLTDGIAPEFAGGFATKPTARKIAYAASCGRDELSGAEKEAYYPLLRDFHAIGVRESGLCRSLMADGFTARTVIDPTLLLDRQDWDRMAASIPSDIRLPKTPYLLVYVFDEDPSIYPLIDRIAQKRGLEVRVIAYAMKPELSAYTVYTDCGPGDFVRLIAGASAVVTTSFHGTVFSLLYEKELYCVPHPTLHARTDSLLALVGLSGRYCTPDTDPNALALIQWEGVRQAISVAKADSEAFLKEAIHG